MRNAFSRKIIWAVSEKNKLVEQTRQPTTKKAMAADNVTAVLLRNLDENISIDHNTEDGSQKTWIESLTH